MGDGEWMCIACNDSRTRDSLGVVRHDDTRVHNDARAHQLMNLGTHRISKPALVGPANRPDDLANILSAIDPGSQEHQLASDWNEGSNYPTSHRDSRPTSPTTAHVIPEEAVPEMPDTPEVQLGEFFGYPLCDANLILTAGKRQMDSSGGNDIESWKRTKVHVDDNMWFPWADKIVSDASPTPPGLRFDCLPAVVMHGRHSYKSSSFSFLSPTIGHPPLVVADQQCFQGSN